MPLDLAIAETADRLSLAVLQIGDDPDLRHRGRGPIGAHGAFERPEQRTERRQLGFTQCLPPEHQHAPARPQFPQRRDGLRLRRFPQAQAEDLAGQARMQWPRLKGHYGSPRRSNGMMIHFPQPLARAQNWGWTMTSIPTRFCATSSPACERSRWLAPARGRIGRATV